MGKDRQGRGASQVGRGIKNSSCHITPPLHIMQGGVFMSNFILELVGGIFVAIGIATVITFTVELIMYRAWDSPKTALTIVATQNNEDTIEGVIRTLEFRLGNAGRQLPKPNILIVDLDSTDETCYILKKIELDYENVYISNRSEYLEKIKNIMERSL